MSAAGPHVSISAEVVGHVLGLPINNSMVASVVVSVCVLVFAGIVRLSLKNTSRPTGLQNLVEAIIEGLRSFFTSVTNDTKKTNQFFPIIASFFLFILLNNWFGLFPFVGTVGKYHQVEAGEEVRGSLYVSQAFASSVTSTLPAITVTTSDRSETPSTGAEPTTASTTGSTAKADAEHGSTEVKLLPLFRAATADLNLTLALGIISVFTIQFFGVKYLHLGYFKKFINFSSPIMFVVGLLELVLEFAKIISFAFRLFGNIFAGEVLLAVISSLVPLVAPMPFYGMEIFVGLIQALVFTMLSLVFTSMATVSHDEH